MGSGKSTLGKKLSTQLKCQFIDLDRFIELKEKKSIAQIFTELGENYFRTLEEKYLKEISEYKEYVVVALGGGTICFRDNLSLTKQIGLLIYIDLPVQVLADRIHNGKNKRPLVSHLKGVELNSFIEKTLSERRPFYDQSNITINGLNLNANYLYDVIHAYYNQNIS